jgi:hypothetical protein
MLARLSCRLRAAAVGTAEAPMATHPLTKPL